MSKLTAGGARAAGIAASLPLAASAQLVAVTVESIGAKIDLAGEQRMLVERMAKLLCFVQSGIRADENLQALEKAHDRFDRVDAGISEGVSSLGLFAEGETPVMAVWMNVDAIWAEADRT